MNIHILQGLAGARRAKGLAVIIDVFRAFSTACYLVDQGAEKIIPVGDLERALQLKRENPDFLLMGERDGHIPVGFDYGNSPFEIRNVDFRGKTVVHTTTSGTQGLVNAKSADEIITGSFVNVGAIIKYIKARNPKDLSLVCTITPDESTPDEDAMCALYIKNALEGKSNNFPKIVQGLIDRGFANHILDPKNEAYPTGDFDYCVALDRFDFVLKAESYQDNLVYLRKIGPQEFAENA